ncbi:MAG: endonuclease III [Bacteroidaceae bacterium]|nr:endonuclease III [Bacteroidaceae bacterium]
MKKQELFDAVLGYLGSTMDATETELHFSNPFELVIAVVLSAQCTDKRINMVTPRLFQDFPSPEAMAETTPEVIYEYIKSVSYPNNKAKHLVGLAKVLVRDFGGEVPSTLEELTQLPGVGRKTANVVQAVAFGKAALAVDTHVFRVSHRLGLVPSSCKTPYSVEMALRKYIPEHLVASSHYWLLLHGRYTCVARKPKCEKCGLATLCKTFKKGEVLK